MKKVKIMLASITVVAVVAGALAFKAKTFASSCYYTSAAANANCPLRGIGTVVGNLGGNVINTTVLGDGIQADCPQFEPCSQKHVTASE